ncbi:MAG TPA: tetratricopeptide repeat protein [Desulfotignum sp.]|nr:tetratricopeptide repeat protein [Desulfotignum sp.]
MNQDSFKRKLSAILSADAVGYSRLMGDDDEATVRTLTLYRTAISDLVQQFRGRIVDNPGDNILAEFTSVVDAVNCSVEIQRELAERNAELPENRRMQFRIGVNLGDVIEEDGRIYGDGVNIAARVESLAEPEGICLSGRVYDQVANRLGLEYENLGKHQVKNISVPIRVYRVLSYPGAAALRAVKSRKTIRNNWRKSLFTAATAVLIVIASGLIWQFQFRELPIKPASEEGMKFSLPEKPSIAILSFENMSNDPEQEYFCDGLAEEIITALSKISKLFVIARNSSFVYKGKPVNIKQVAEDLGVRYVLEGSFRKAGEKVRITAQLIDATKGHHIWAERYEGEIEDIFKFQDQITHKIVVSLGIELVEGEQLRVWSKRFKKNPKLALKFYQALENYNKHTREDMHKARRIWKEMASELPENERSSVYGCIGVSYLADVFAGWSKSPKKSMETANEFAQKALKLDKNTAEAYGIISWIYLMQGDYEKAVAIGEKAIKLCPNCAYMIAYHGVLMSYACRFEMSVSLLEKAIRLNPLPPLFYFARLGISYYHVGRYEDAIKILKKVLQSDPQNFWANVGLTVAYNLSGRESDARKRAETLRRLYPNFSLQHAKNTLPYKDPDITERTINALRKAGIHEISSNMPQS